MANARQCSGDRRPTGSRPAERRARLPAVVWRTCPWGRSRGICLSGGSCYLSRCKCWSLLAAATASEQWERKPLSPKCSPPPSQGTCGRGVWAWVGSLPCWVACILGTMLSTCVEVGLSSLDGESRPACGVHRVASFGVLNTLH